MKNKFIYLFIFALLMSNGLFGTLAYSAPKGDKRPVVPCAHPMFRTFDFWVGDWKVYHRETGELAGFDRVGRTLKGCALQQSWISLDDHFSSPQVPFRMNGKSLTVFNGKIWTQLWVDNQAGSQVTTGIFQDGMMVLTSETPIRDHIYQLKWKQEKDGTVSHTASNKKIGEEKWTVLFDFIYRRNVGDSLSIQKQN